jgi:hypothetical protein
MSVEPAKYRIRGLSELEVKLPAPILEKTIDPEIPIIRVIAAPELRTPLFLNMAFTAIGPPKLSDFIHHAPVDRLNAWWPTFDLFTKQCQNPIKIHPVALGPYVPDSRTLLSTPEFKVIEEFCKMQNKERDNINRVLDAAEDMTQAPPSLNAIDTPVATAVLSVLFRGSTWVKRHEARFRKIISRSPVAAYIVFHLGRPNQRETFLKYILPDARLMLSLCAKRQLLHLLSPDLLAQAFEKVPHFRPLARFVSEDLNEANAWKTLTDYAVVDPLSAAFALGLQPTDERARQWHALVSLHPAAIYWALRVWTVYHPSAQFPYWAEYRMLIKKDICWLYHWCRDIDQTEAREAVRWHWPNPWAVEMIVDLKLEPEFVRELCQASFSNSDPDDPWTSALVLWAAAYIEAKEKNENETSQDD